jgi:polyhydroxybutyrate depolymerase
VYYTPTNWDNTQQVPLLILLHGLTQTGSGVMDITQFNPIAEQNNFIVVYPDGENFAWNANMNVSISTADDIGFIETLAQHFQNNFSTNPLKQYLVGFSNGGFMSHKIACESSMCFAGIATVSGNMSDTVYNNCNPQFSPAVLHMHGTADAIVPYNGGSGTGVSVDQTINKWKNFLFCDPTPITTDMPNTNIFDLSSPQRISYQNGLNELELIKINGGGHQWPGIQTLVGGAGTINFDFYSPQYIWDFLNGKSCPSNSIKEIDENNLVWPNPASDYLYFKDKTITTFEIVDMKGNTILKGANHNNSVFIGNLDLGMYFLILKRDDSIEYINWIKS